MALEVFVGTVRSLVSDALSTTYTLTPGFTTKAGIVFHTGRGETTDTPGLGGTDGATQRRSIGFFTSPSNRWNAGSMSVDTAAAGSGNEFQATVDVARTVQTDTATVDGRLDVSSITSTTCVFILDDSFPVDLVFGVILFGGSDITNAIVVQFDIGTGTGTIDITTVGFQGTVLFLTGTDELGEANDGAGGQLFFGACTGAGDEHVWWGGMDQGSASADTGAYCLAGEVMVEWSGAINSPAAAGNRAEFSAWLSNGFRLNRLITTRTGVDAGALVIQGGSWTVGSFTTLTSTGSITSESTGFGYTPKGVIVVSALRAVSTSPNSTVHNQLSIGAADASTQHAQAMVDEDGVANMEVATAIEYDEVYINLNTADTVVGAVSVTSFDADGITFNQDDADPAANFCFYIACGNTPAGFDAAFMAAMQHREPRVANLVEVVPGGMTPPEFIPT